MYKDKHGEEIKARMLLVPDNEDTEKVFSNLSEDDLGFNATNMKFMELHPGSNERSKIYPLSQFYLCEWEIIKGDNRIQSK